MIEILINIALTLIATPFVLVMFISVYYLILYAVEVLTGKTDYEDNDRKF